MDPTPRLTQLKDSVQKFETILEKELSPTDSQDIEAWVESLRVAFDDLHQIIQDQRQPIHNKLFEKVEDADPTQENTIRELKQADDEIEKLLEVVRSQLVVLQMEANEEEVARLENQTSDDEQVLEMTNRGAELICWIRGQEEAVTAWFAEAFAGE